MTRELENQAPGYATINGAPWHPQTQVQVALGTVAYTASPASTGPQTMPLALLPPSPPPEVLWVISQAPAFLGSGSDSDSGLAGPVCRAWVTCPGPRVGGGLQASSRPIKGEIPQIAEEDSDAGWPEIITNIS